MDGLNNNFINKYHEFVGGKSEGGKELSENELKHLEKMISSGDISPEAAKALRDEIVKGGINDQEKELLIAMGHAMNSEAKLEKYQKALDVNPTSGQISNLLERGFQERKNELSRESNSSPKESFMRNVSDMLGVTSLTKVVGAVTGNDTYVLNSAQEEADEETRNLVASKSKIFSNSVEDVDCIKDSLNFIAEKNPGLFKLNKVDTKAVSQISLIQATGKVWDGVNISEAAVKDKDPNDKNSLHNLLKDQVGKALIVVGSHTFVFDGFDAKGNLNVIDPSDGKKSRTIDKNNPAASAYVMGYGDGSATRGLNKGSDTTNIHAMLKPYSQVSPEMNSADKGNPESNNVRKLFSFMSDPAEKAGFAAMEKFVNNNDAKGLQKFLAAKGIHLDMDELQNMILKMKEPLDGKGTTMMDKMRNLQNASENDRTRFRFAIQFSDVNMSDFFTRTSAAAMNEVFGDMIEGRDGC
jgi:hypothetical protein